MVIAEVCTALAPTSNLFQLWQCFSSQMGMEFAVFLIIFACILFVLFSNINIGVWWISGALILIGLTMISSINIMTGITVIFVVIFAGFIWITVIKKIFDK